MTSLRICLACLAIITACSSEVEAPEPLDQAVTDYYEFDCTDAGRARMRFVGPDTIELLLNDEPMILTLERSASGAKYAGGDVIFWNKGDEALLSVGEARHNCTKLLDEPVELALWPDQAPPFSKDVPNEEYVDACWGGVRCAHNVTVPTLTLHPASSPSQNWILIAPGGGYGVVAIFHEGSDIAQTLVNRGISAAVLKYRIPDAETAIAPEKVALADLRRAISMLRAEQERMGVRNGKIGLVGFSATGHLSVYSMVHPDPDPSLNVDFAIIAYGVSQLNAANEEWLENSLYYRPLNAAEKSSEDLLSRVDEQTPPAFLIHAKDDDVVPFMESVMYAEALRQHGVEVELHIIEDGGHGFGPGRDEGGSRGWLQLAADWIEQR